MCVKKADATDGDGRCFPHMKGTQASVDMTACLTELPINDVKQVSRDLKREGKNLPTPSQDEVVSFTMSQQFTAKYDPRIPEKKRKTWGNRWKQAEKEKPSGGEFHSWVNTMKESVKRIQFKRTFASIMIGSSIIATAACGSTPPPNNNTTAPSSEVTISAPATPNNSTAPTTAAPTASSASEPVIAAQTKKKLKAQGIETKDTVKVKGGSYPQYKVSEDSHLAKFEASRHIDGTPSGWTKADLQKGQTAAANYMMNTVLDNPTLNDYEANKSVFISQLKKETAPKYSNFFAESVNSKEGSVFFSDTFTDNFKGDNAKGFRYVSDGVTPRIADVSNLKSTSSQNYNGDVYYEYSGTTTMNVVDKSNNPYTFENNVIYGLTVSKVGNKFLISGGNFVQGQYANPVPAK